MAKRTKCFVGIEAEGPHRGQKTLFVPGSVGPEDFFRAYSLVAGEVDRLYLGAGEDRNLNGFTLAAAMAAVPPSRITIEVEEIGPLWPCIPGPCTVVSLNPVDLMNRADFYKTVEGGEIKWMGGPGFEYVTRIDDPLFDQDKEI